MNLINMRDGGINGVKLTWEECETEYKPDRGVECYERLKTKGPTGASMFHPLSIGIAYALLERRPRTRSRWSRSTTAAPTPPTAASSPTSSRSINPYWSENAAIVSYIGQREGGIDEAEGQEDRPPLPRDAPYGKETIP